MVLIQSEQGIAQTHATALQSACDAILSVGKATKDGSTTLAGNSNAGDAIDADKAKGDLSVTRLNQFYESIQQVASDFVAMDQQIASDPVVAMSHSSSRDLFSGQGVQ